MTKKESIAAAKKLAEGLGGKWRVRVIGKTVPFSAYITNGTVYILQHDPAKKEYTAAFEGMNYELESWDGKTPAEALRKLVKHHAKRVSDLLDYIVEMQDELPLMRKKQADLEALLPVKHS